ncbi:MAG TPA: NUMOD4 motif-containing HNH endonuclease [Leptospiraceae bacterium]|nr:NUMOD4 motif-containing HNH endonuclease [Leptospiraceae bacterium]
METWKDIKGFEGVYQVSDAGSVRRLVSKIRRNTLENPRILKQKTDRDGYKEIHLWNKGSVKFIRVHRLVLNAFYGECPIGFQTAHLDGSKDNNRIENLMWVSPQENTDQKIAHGTWTHGDQCHTSKLSIGDVRSIREMRRNGLSLWTIGRRFGVTAQAISAILRGISWAHVA